MIPLRQLKMNNEDSMIDMVVIPMLDMGVTANPNPNPLTTLNIVCYKMNFNGLDTVLILLFKLTI